MMLSNLVCITSFIVLGLGNITVAIAQEYPQKLIRMVVPFASGGGADIIGRDVSQGLTKTFGQPVVVENRGGGNIGTEIVAKALGDGYTLLMVASAHAITPSLYRDLPFDPVKDFAPVTQVTSQLLVMAVHPSVPAKSLKEYLTLAKAKPVQLFYSSGGNGTSAHLAGELLKILAGVDIVHVPYKGGGPAIVSLLAGDVSMNFGSVSSMVQFLKTGKLRALAVTGTQRSQVLPELPTGPEAGLPGFEVSNWNGVLAPAGTPKAIVAKLHAAIATLLRSPEMKERLAAAGTDPVGSSPEEFGAYIQAEIIKWGKVVKAARIRLD